MRLQASVGTIEVLSRERVTVLIVEGARPDLPRIVELLVD
jgi:hypothetical protein